MRPTLRRSCDACAASKLRCDLRKPRCSRCVKRKMRRCVYVNEPLTPCSTQRIAQHALSRAPLPTITLGNSVDHFDSLPPTRLPPARVHQLIQHFLSNIAFQYYPLDLDKSSNPFVVSWWPLALNDAALFHVSLQTASLDLDLKAQRGFETSDMLMADSIALVRRRVEDQFLACGDETIDSVVTLAAIEFGKGNTHIGRMHIEGVKKMVHMRGGIHALKHASPLTARMVAWVSLVLMQQPQFNVQNDHKSGDAIAPIQEWTQLAESRQLKLPQACSGLELDSTVGDTIVRLRTIFDVSQQQTLSTTDLHDLTCFVLHQLLSLPPKLSQTTAAHARSECLRYALSLYMLIIHGPTYFTHAHLQHGLVSTLKAYMNEVLHPLLLHHGPVALWVVSVGLVAADDTRHGPWFLDQAKALCHLLDLHTWPDVLVQLETVLWYGRLPHTEDTFRRRWETALLTTR